MTALGHALPAYLTALRVERMTRPRFERWQARQLARWLREDLPGVRYYRTTAPGATRLAELPVIDKAEVMADFAAFNRAAFSAEQGWAALAGSGEIDGVSLGASTGTSGNRALYAITEAERFRWLGAMLAKALPGFWTRRERVAVVLPQSSALYEGANRAAGLRLGFFDLREGPERWGERLVGFAPTTLVAPPRVLRHLAETLPGLAPRRLFAGAETLDPVDRAAIEAHFARPLGQIYMATEGLFAVSCRLGRLHLAEDATHFELEPVGEGLVAPIVTGFRRRFQIMARYRMNDLLRLSPAPCPCGSPLRAVDEVVGRCDDAFAFGPVLVTPDILRNAVLAVDRAIDDFRIWRTGAAAVTLVLPPRLPDAAAEAARRALAGCLARRGLGVSVTLHRAPLPLDLTRKLRRVENRWRPENWKPGDWRPGA